MYEGFGVTFECRFSLPELPRADGSATPDVVFEVTTGDDVAQRFSGRRDPRVVRTAMLGDGCRFDVERGRGDDRLILYGDRASFHISSDTSVVACAPSEHGRPEWRRFLLDTVLGTVCLLRGFEALHAAAWLEDESVVAVIAGEGGGKTTLLAEKLRAGRTMFCDDILALSRRGKEVVAFPGPPLLNLTPKLPDGTPAESMGRVLAFIDGECWTAIDRPTIGPAPVAGVIFLDRMPGTETNVERVPRSATPLLAHSLRSGSDPDRLARRFNIFGELASSTTMLHVTTPSDSPPAAVARLLDREMAGR